MENMVKINVPFKIYILKKNILKAQYCINQFN